MERKNTIRNLVLVAAGIVGLFMAFGGTGMVASGVGASPEVKAFAENRLVPMDTYEYGQVMAQANGRPTLMFVYASWCPWCKKQFPMLDALQARFNDKELQMVYVSIDKNPYELTRFLMDTYPQQPFTPYHANSRVIGEFYDALAQKGFTHTGSIPYLVLTDKNGKAAGEFRGLTEIPVLLEAIKKVR